MTGVSGAQTSVAAISSVTAAREGQERDTAVAREVLDSQEQAMSRLVADMFRGVGQLVRVTA